MKRALRILGEPGDHSAAPPLHVSVGGRAFSVADAHDGTAEARFVSHLRAEGAVDALTRAEVQVSREGTSLTLSGQPDDELFDHAATSVARSGARLRRLAPRRRSLDDLFADERPPAGGGS